jgi:hypothetical protein
VHPNTSALSTIQPTANEHVSMNGRDDFSEQQFQKRLSAVVAGSSPRKMFGTQSAMSTKQPSAGPMVYTNVRPSTAFIGVSRENQVQKSYVDSTSKKPSSLLRRDDLPSLRSQGVINLPFNAERDGFQQLNLASTQAAQKIASFVAQSDY